MPRGCEVEHQLAVASRLAVRGLRRRLSGSTPATAGDHRFRASLEPGESVTSLADGRVYLSRALEIRVGPSFQLWCRVGERGPVFRGTRATHTFTARGGGRLWLASCFPGQWADPSGRLGTPASEYARVSGSMSVLTLRWPPGTDARALFRQFARDTGAPELVQAEAERLEDPAPAPEYWD